MIVKDNKKIKLYYGNCRPVRVMKNNKLLGGWKKVGMNSSEAEFDNTFNDVITLNGRGANIPAESKSGEVITADNVYEVEHTLNCYLTSDTATDFSGVKVSRYGKNLAPPFFRRSKTVLITENNADGFKVEPNTDYTIHFPIHEAMDQVYVHLVQDGKNAVYVNVQGNAEIKRTFNTGNNTEIFLQVNCFSAAEDESILQALELLNNNTQLERGTTATPYEPYKEPQTVTANADGTVDGLTSLSPNMTIMTDGQDAIINVHYLKSLSSDSLPPTPDNIRPVIGAKCKITVTDREGTSYETQCPELYSIEVGEDAPYNYTETVNGEKKYYITDTLEGKTITRRIGKLELTGAEDGWERYINGNEKTFVLPCNTSLKSSLVKCICNAFIGLARSEIYRGGMGISCSGDFIRVSQEIDGVFLRDIELFKGFLAEQYAKGTPVTIYYALAEPVIENIENYPKSLPFYTHINVKTEKGYFNYGMQECIKVLN